MEMNFYRAALLAVTIFFVGCDEAPKSAQTTIPATVLEGKTCLLYTSDAADD